MNVTWQNFSIKAKDREKLLGQKGKVIWFTGLSASGKSTIADALERELFRRGFKTYLLDGDNVRHGLCSDLGFSSSDRRENIRRVGEVARLFCDAGLVVLASFITPFEQDRQKLRTLFRPDQFMEIYVKCSRETCLKRDPKKLYERGIADFTYEEPQQPGLVLDTDTMTVSESLFLILNRLGIE